MPRWTCTRNRYSIVLKDDTGKILRESKPGKDEEKILEFLDGTYASVVMESGYNRQHIRDVLKEKGYDVKVAHQLMVEAIAYAKVKSDKVDARTLADLLRADVIPESFVPDEKTREVRDLVRRRHSLPETRTAFSEASAFWLRNFLERNVSPSTLLNDEKTISTIPSSRSS
jgi:transposase